MTRLLEPFPRLAVFAISSTMLAAGCSSPTSPDSFKVPDGAYRSAFTTLNGEAGFGGMSVTPKAVPEGVFAADISVRVFGLKPNSTYLVQRAQEGVANRPLGADGICQRAMGLPPWSPADPPAFGFQTMPLPAPGPLITIATTSDGDGAVDFEFRALMVLAGTTNDVMFRVIDNDVSPAIEMRSQCMMITAR